MDVAIPEKVFVSILLFLTGMLFGQTDYESQRKHMVSVQLQKRDIKNRPTLDAMSMVPRHRFVPDDLKEYAYEDRPLPIGEGQTISQPYIVAFMTQSLDLKPEYKVLEIGTGSGYQAAVLAEIVDSVFTIEIVEKLGLTAKNRLAQMGYANIEVKIGDGYHGWQEKCPFDAIIVTAGAEKIPPKLIEQLKEGGKMIIPVGPSNAVEQLVLVTKKNGKVKTKELMPVRFVPFTREKNR